MAKKKSFNIRGTLKKNTEEPTLPKKVPLGKSTKDMDEIKERVDSIHEDAKGPSSVKSERETQSAPTSSTPSKAPTTGTRKKAEEKPEKLVRITVDTPQSVHMKLKIRSIQGGVTLREYILRLIEADLNE